MSSPVRGSTPLALLACGLLSVGLVGGCGGTRGPSEALPSESVTQAASPTQVPTPEPSVPQASESASESEYGSVDPTASIGQVIRSSGFADEVCSNEFPAADVGSTRADDRQLLDQGRLFLACPGGYLLMDLFGGRVIWSRESGAVPGSSDEQSVSESVVPGPDHVYVVTTTNHPAVDLDAAYLSREVEAYDAQTGQLAWSAPLEDFVPKLERSATSYSIEESPASTGQDIVVISGDSHSAFEASTGEPKWNAEEITGEYLGLGMSLESNSWNDDRWTAYDAGTGAERWKKAVPDVGGSDVFLEGTTLWQIGRRGVIALDLPTGRQVLNRLYPEAWADNAHVVTPSYALAYDGSDLQMFRTEDLRKPLWSTPSDPVTPLVVTRDLALVQAQSGLVVIDGRTGQIRTDVYLPEDASSSDWSVTDGLTLLDDGSILELSPPSGLAAPPPTMESGPSSDPATPPTT